MKICDCCGQYIGCDHCGEVDRAITKWTQDVHETCPCLCHYWKSKRGRDELAERKKEAKKRKKKKLW